MQGTELTVQEPDRIETVTVNQAGQAYLGKDLSGKDVELVLKVVEDREPGEAKPEASAD
jgi:hypothetical protein